MLESITTLVCIATNERMYEWMDRLVGHRYCYCWCRCFTRSHTVSVRPSHVSGKSALHAPNVPILYMAYASHFVHYHPSMSISIFAFSPFFCSLFVILSVCTFYAYRIYLCSSHGSCAHQFTLSIADDRIKSNSWIIMPYISEWDNAKYHVYERNLNARNKWTLYN